ncbi:DUF692 domain-containing protein [Gammaproteobacteria bacterium AS21]
MAISSSNTVEKMHSNIEQYAIGIGLRAAHHQQILADKPAVDWLEVHSENFFSAHSAQRQYLDEVADNYALSFHGIGLSLGSSDPINKQHLLLMKDLIDTYQPALISEHVSWSSLNSRYFNDLLPVPYTDESLNLFADRLNQVQDFLGRQLLVENPTTYLSFDHSTMPEWEFLNKIQQKCQSGLLLDLNNIYVNSVNLGLNALDYLKHIDIDAVQEIHLAGFTRKQLENGEILIDTHGSAVSEPVWDLFRYLRQYCAAPALIEWDSNIPQLSVLLEQVDRARAEQLTHSSQVAKSLVEQTKVTA